MYAVDLLGFGWSEKALIEYDALVWRDQVVDFVKEIVKEPTVLVGNRQVSIYTELGFAYYFLLSADLMFMCYNFLQLIL